MTEYKKNILVSGGDGFIGSHLVEALSNLDYEIFVIDNNITSIPRNTNLNNVKHIKSSIEFLDLNEIPEIDIIFHLASIASPLVYKNDFNNVYGPNVLGTMKLIELSERDHARLIYSSTSEVYGMLSNEYINENQGIKEDSIARIHLLTERSIYASSKRMGEELIYHFKQRGGDAVNIRFFNVYGHGMDVVNTGYGRVIPNFINGILNEGKITIFGNGNQIRSFLWIDDAIEALITVMNYQGVLPDAVNLGNNEPISINDLAKILIILLNKKCSIIYEKIDRDDPLWRKPNIDLAEKLFNWKPKVSLIKGLQELIGGSKTKYPTNLFYLIDLLCNERCSKCSHWKYGKCKEVHDMKLIYNFINEIETLEEVCFVGG